MSRRKANTMADLKKDGTQVVLTGGAGPVAQYQTVVTGHGGWWNLLKYELITVLFGSCPGAMGFWLRRKFYPFLFRKCGKRLTIGRNVVLRHPHRVSFGDNVIVDSGCTIDAKGDDGEGVVIGDGVFIGAGTIISMAGGTIEIDDGANIGSYCRIGTYGHTRVGKKVLLAAYCYLVGATHETDSTDIPIIDQPTITLGGVTVGDGSWLGARVTVMDGRSVGGHTVVGAHAVVTEDLPDFCIAYGVPAKVVRMRK